eukprot:GHVO01045630.1.p1 GENE.GHVO01045630.1~~GHVO01045630.1.p1  ORF type:complete len:469 (+),score=91.53 GHVO01045630.1:38-1444(+)
MGLRLSERNAGMTNPMSANDRYVKFCSLPFVTCADGTATILNNATLYDAQMYSGCRSQSSSASPPHVSPPVCPPNTEEMRPAINVTVTSWSDTDIDEYQSFVTRSRAMARKNISPPIIEILNASDKKPHESTHGILLTEILEGISIRDIIDSTIDGTNAISSKYVAELMVLHGSGNPDRDRDMFDINKLMANELRIRMRNILLLLNALTFKVDRDLEQDNHNCALDVDSIIFKYIEVSSLEEFQDGILNGTYGVMHPNNISASLYLNTSSSPPPYDIRDMKIIPFHPHEIRYTITGKSMNSYPLIKLVGNNTSSRVYDVCPTYRGGVDDAVGLTGVYQYSCMRGGIRPIGDILSSLALDMPDDNQLDLAGRNINQCILMLKDWWAYTMGKGLTGLYTDMKEKGERTSLMEESLAVLNIRRSIDKVVDMMDRLIQQHMPGGWAYSFGPHPVEPPVGFPSRDFKQELMNF